MLWDTTHKEVSAKYIWIVFPTNRSQGHIGNTCSCKVLLASVDTGMPIKAGNGHLPVNCKTPRGSQLLSTFGRIEIRASFGADYVIREGIVSQQSKTDIDNVMMSHYRSGWCTTQVRHRSPCSQRRLVVHNAGRWCTT